MNKGLIIIVTIVVAILLVFGILFSMKPKTAETAKPRRLEVQDFLDQAEQSLEQGRVLRAKELYTKIIEEYPDSEFIRNATNALEEINIKLLFSPTKTKDSIIYIVQDGDSLGKIAKKFSTTVELLKKSNRLESDVIHPGKRLKVSTAKYSILVDKSQNTLMLKSNGEILKIYTVSTGIDNSTPTGDFKIVNKLVEPVWYKAGAIVPSGSAENILGSRWMGISEPGYGIHGTTQPETIGTQITAGCVRMINNEVEELYTIVPVGTEVTIVD